MVNNRFFQSQLTCGSSVYFSGSGNLYCGSGTLQGTCTGNNVNSIKSPYYSAYDSCGICGGNNQNKDCTGTCFGSATNCPSPTSKYHFLLTSLTENKIILSVVGYMEWNWKRNIFFTSQYFNRDFKCKLPRYNSCYAWHIHHLSINQFQWESHYNPSKINQKFKIKLTSSFSSVSLN